MIVAIVGSRTGFRYADIHKGMMYIIEHGNLDRAITAVVSGGAKGVDTFGERWAKSRKLRFIKITPQWTKYGKTAGFKRNQIIVDKADLLVVFWDGKSKGTKHTYDLGVKADLRIFLIKKTKEVKKKPLANSKTYGFIRHDE